MNLVLEKLVENPAPRIPVVIVMDNSSSMNAENKIGILNKELMNLVDLFRKDEIMAYSIELGLVAFEFNNKTRITKAKEVLSFENLLDQKVPQLKAFGQTPLGESVELALDMLEKRKNLYKRCRCNSFK